MISMQTQVEAHVAAFESSTPSILIKLSVYQQRALQALLCRKSHLVPGFVFR